MSKIDDYQFQLTDGERTHPLWQKLAQRFEQMIEVRRKANDSNLDPIETATLRGEINLLKAIQSYGKERPYVGPPTQRAHAPRAGVM